MKNRRKNEIVKWSVITGALLLIIFVAIQNHIDKKNILQNPFPAIATITGIKGCFKNGRCITYKYTYNGKVYNKVANTSWGFSNWCKNKGNCIGFKFKITIDKKNPKKVLVNWEEVFDNKNFINYP